MGVVGWLVVRERGGFGDDTNTNTNTNTHMIVASIELQSGCGWMVGGAS